MKFWVLGKICAGSVAWAENLLYAGHDVTVINTHLIRRECPEAEYLRARYSVSTHHLYESHSFPYGLQSRLHLLARHAGISRRDPPYCSQTSACLSGLLSKTAPDAILAWWGYDLYYEMYLLYYRLGLSVPLIHVLNTFPADTIGLGYGMTESLFYRIFHEKVAGRIFFSPEMKRCYEEYIGDAGSHLTVIEPYLRRNFAPADVPPRHSLVRTDGNPYIVFTGRTDFSRHPGRRKDDIRADLRRIADERIHVYIRRTEVVRESAFIHFYPEFSVEEIMDGTFAGYLRQFDAALAIYNEFSAKRRYTTSLCTRFAHTLTACIPMITRALSTFACHFFRAYENGFTYRREKEIRQQLQDAPRMAVLRAGAALNADHFSFEACEQDFGELLVKVTGS